MIVFSSSPYFEQIYKYLTKEKFKIDLLVTESPKPAGRGLHFSKNPAHIFAKKVNLRVIYNLDQLASHQLKDDQTFDLGIIFAYGQIIPKNVIGQFKHGILNIHPSLLPKYRGASPIAAAILNNDKKTGYTIILADECCDTGKIVAQRDVEIKDIDNHDSLKEKIMTLAIKDLPKIIKDYIEGKISPKTQENKSATHTSKIKKSDAVITEKDNARSAFNKIRAYSDWPKAYLLIGDKRIIIHSGKIEEDKLKIDEIQLAGKNKITFSEFKNGYPGLLTKLPDFVKV